LSTKMGGGKTYFYLRWG